MLQPANSELRPAKPGLYALSIVRPAFGGDPGSKCLDALQPVNVNFVAEHLRPHNVESLQLPGQTTCIPRELVSPDFFTRSQTNPFPCERVGSGIKQPKRKTLRHTMRVRMTLRTSILA